MLRGFFALEFVWSNWPGTWLVILTKFKSNLNRALGFRLLLLYLLYYFQQRIEMCDYTGENRQVLIEIDYRRSHTYGLTVTGNYMYWTDGPNSGIYRAEKRVGAKETLIIGNLSGLMDIHAISMQAAGETGTQSTLGVFHSYLLTSYWLIVKKVLPNSPPEGPHWK